MSRNIGSYKNMRRDKNFSTTNAISRLNVPVVLELPDVNVNQTGNLVFNLSDNTFYGFSNGEWNSISNEDVVRRLEILEDEVFGVQSEVELVRTNENANITTATSGSQNIAAQGGTQTALINQLQTTVTNLQNSFNSFRNSIQSLISDTPVSRTLQLRATPDVLSIKKLSVVEAKIQSETFGFIEDTLADWQPLIGILDEELGALLAYDEETTATSLRFESQIIPSSLQLPLTFGFYSGSLNDWENLSTSISEQDLINSGDLTNVITVTNISARANRTATIIDNAPDPILLDVQLYDDDSNLLQTAASITITIANAALAAATVPITIPSFTWNGAQYETNLFSSVLTNLTDAYDPRQLRLEILTENASGPPNYGDNLELQGTIDTEAWVGYNFCQVTRGNTEQRNNIGFRTPNYNDDVPEFIELPFTDVATQVPDYFFQWTPSLGFESFLDLTLFDYRSDARWRTAANSIVIPWNDSYLGQNWNSPIDPGLVVYDTSFTFSRDGTSIDGQSSITGANYVGIGGYPYAYFEASSSPDPPGWRERITQIENFGFQ